MGDGADDAFDQELREADRAWDRRLGIKRCPRYEDHYVDDVCPICQDLNFIDKDGNPTESH